MFIFLVNVFFIILEIKEFGGLGCLDGEFVIKIYTIIDCHSLCEIIIKVIYVLVIMFLSFYLNTKGEIHV